MERPIKKNYLTTNQFTYNEKLREYYEALEKYIDYLEPELKQIAKEQLKKTDPVEFLLESIIKYKIDSGNKIGCVLTNEDVFNVIKNQIKETTNINFEKENSNYIAGVKIETDKAINENDVYILSEGEYQEYLKRSIK